MQTIATIKLLQFHEIFRRAIHKVLEVKEKDNWILNGKLITAHSQNKFETHIYHAFDLV